jgi:hypothetical protein
MRPAGSRMRLVLSQLIDQLKMPHAPGKTHPYPRLRNFVLDVLAEGRRKHIVHIMLEAEIGGIQERLAERRQRGQASPRASPARSRPTSACKPTGWESRA